jgi:hypothetical protein
MKNFFYLFFFIFSIENIASQTLNVDPNTLVSSQDKLLVSALDSSIVVIRQDYILRDTSGNEFGYRGKPYYGRVFRMGYVINNRVLTDSSLISPWMNDANYLSKAVKVDTLKPYLSETLIKFKGDSKWRKIDQDFTTGNFGMISLYDSCFEYPSLIFDTRNEDINGWLIMGYFKEDPIINDTISISYQIVKMKPKFSDGKASVTLPILKNKYSIGGFYFVPNVISQRISLVATGYVLPVRDQFDIIVFKSSKILFENNLITPIISDKAIPDDRNKKRDKKNKNLNSRNNIQDDKKSIEN